MPDAGGARNQHAYDPHRAFCQNDAMARQWAGQIRGRAYRDRLGAMGIRRKCGGMVQTFSGKYGPMMDRSLFWIGIASISWWSIHTLPVTRLVFNPVSVQIDGENLTIYRSFPGDALDLPRPRMSYIEAVKPMTQGHNGGQICQDVADPFRYIRAEEVGKWSILWASECLSDPVGYVWESCWSWHVGEIGLGPVCLSQRILK